ncbi:MULTISPECIES: glycosyltransferase [unclassified Thioalkalivibrio]|uniref:glycosyltransferase n=1 Tax=unclassified Thioalkalivibrio TaxID=2621013 RepID=UPI00056DE908|nr:MULTISPECIES: glycosyltransferase [unclassified Thioalkalivibrio]
MLSDVYFPRINGVSTSLASFRAQLRQLGHRVTLVVPAYPGLGAHPGPDPQDPDLIRIPSRYLVVDPEDRILKPRLIRRSLREAGIERADVVHVHTPFVAHYAGLKLARDWQVPVIETYHTFFEEYLQHYLPWLPAKWLRGLARRISRAQCNAVDRVIAPSTALHQALLEYGIKTPIVRLPTGIDPQAWTGGDGHLFRAERGIAPGREMLVHVSRIAFEKNIGFLLQMLQHLRERRPGVLLLIAGEGPARAALQRQAAQMGLEDNLHWCGYLDRETSLVDCYRAGHAFVFASATETQGLVLLEAMACGLPVVSTARLGTRDILTDASGAEVAPEEPAVFAERVARVLDDPERQRAMRAAHAAWAREWSERRMAEQLLTVYQDLLSPADALGTPHTAADRPR